MATFIISGLWHGANWTFVFWGGIHGLAQIIEKICTSNHSNTNHSNKSTLTSVVFRWLAVFIFCNLTWVFFRARTFTDAVYVLTHALGKIQLTSGIGLSKLKLLFCLVNIAIIALFDFFSLKTDVISVAEEHRFISVLASYALLALIFIALLFGNGANQFVYFQF